MLRGRASSLLLLIVLAGIAMGWVGGYRSPPAFAVLWIIGALFVVGLPLLSLFQRTVKLWSLYVTCPAFPVGHGQFKRATSETGPIAELDCTRSCSWVSVVAVCRASGYDLHAKYALRQSDPLFVSARILNEEPR